MKKQNFKKIIKKIVSSSLIFSLIISWAYGLIPGFEKFSPETKVAEAANTKIRQEINIIDGYMMSPANNYATSSEIVAVTDTSYTSPYYYFEAVASSTSGTTATAKLVNATTGATVASVTMTNGGTYTRYRSASFLPSSSSTVEYKVVTGNETMGKGITAARIIVLQNTATLSNTETQIEIGNNETYTNTATSTFASPKYWYYDSTKWDGSPVFYAEVTYARTVDVTVASSTTYASAGTFTYIGSANVASVKVEAWGAGGGGGVNNTEGGGGGGGGAYAQSTLSVAAGSSHTLVVGTGQASDTTTESDTTYDTTTVVADGGEGSGTNTAGTAGTAAASTGTITANGGNGGASFTTLNTGGGGGGAGGPDGAGATGAAGTATIGGAGGAGDNGSGGTAGTGGNAANGGSGGDNILGGGGGGGSGGDVASSTTYSVSGTFTVVIPTNTASTSIQMWGGGGGGGAASTNTTGSGSGGAGGQYANKTIQGLGGLSKTLVVGALGAGGVNTAAGTRGATSTWDTTIVVAVGGAGGAANSGTAGQGSTANGVGDVVNAGGNGAAGASGGTSGGGGEGAGSTGTGGSASGGTAGSGTDGGDGGTGQATNGTPAAASAPGGGGAGGRSTGTPNADGGAGAAGKAIIIDDISTYTGGAGGAPGGGGGGSGLTGGTGGNGQIKLTETINQLATTTIALQEDNGSFSGWTDKVYIVVGGDGSSATRTRSLAFTPTSGRNYRIVFKEGYSGATHAIYNAKIVVDQTTPTKLQPQYLINNTATSTLGLAKAITLYDPDEWGNITNTYIHQIDSSTDANDQAKLQSNVTGVAADITNSTTATGVANRATSTTAGMTMPTGTATQREIGDYVLNGPIYASRILVDVGPPPDTTPPTPDPMTFASAPAPDSTSQISMTGSTATDAATPPVEYLFGYFTCAFDGGTGGTGSNWQAGTGHTDSGLQPNRCYGYKVQARDSASTPNETASSSQAEIYTWANIPGAPTLTSPSATTLTLTNDANGNPSSNPTTNFTVQIVNTLPLDSNWEGKYVNAVGSPSASEIWLSDSQLDNLVITGLAGSTYYEAKSKARNENLVATSFGGVGSNTTSATPASATGRIIRLMGGTRFLGGVRLK